MSKQNQRESFIFYRSFYEALKEADDATQLKIYQSIAEYALNHKESKLDGIGSIIFKLIKPQLDANWKRYENGCKGKEFGSLGGAPKGNSNAVKQPQNNPIGIDYSTPNDNINENLNKNKNKKENYNQNQKGNYNVKDKENEYRTAKEFLEQYHAGIHPVMQDANDDLPWG